MTMPINTQIKPATEPIIHWGVHFIKENVISDYGPGDEAKAAAEETVKHWAGTDFPAELKVQVVLPWSSSADSVVAVVRDIRHSVSDMYGTKVLRDWLIEHKYETVEHRKTGLAAVVPHIRNIRSAREFGRAVEAMTVWLDTNGYTTK
jgi:hypothetical protein